MPQPLIIDLHLDLAWDALFWNRDLTLSALRVREQEASEKPQVAAGFDTGLCSVTFPEMRRGSVGIMISTIMSRIETRDVRRRDGMRTQEQAMAMGRGHLAYYRTMTQRGQIKPVRCAADLDEAESAWSDPTGDTPIYHVLSMESADPIADADDVAFWWDAGLRIVGPAHFGDNTYIHGTEGTGGGLKPPALPLYKAMREAGIILDITHMADEAVFESFNAWDGPTMASHCTCRAIVEGQRHLTDDMIREVIQRDGIIGLVFCQHFLDPKIHWAHRTARPEGDSRPPLEALLPHIEHIGDLAGGSLSNIAIGTDMDGGFGAELTPEGIDTIADLQKFGIFLGEAGYGQADVEGILHGNALRFFRRSWT